MTYSPQGATTMKHVQNCAAQGDLYLRRIDAIPSNATPVAPANGRHVLAHSETGHDHWMAADGVTVFADPSNQLVCYLRIDGDGGHAGGSAISAVRRDMDAAHADASAVAFADLLHARPFDTHETLRIAPGTWEVRRQREMTPDGWRRVED